MAFDFPANPTIGQEYLNYTWNGANWVLTSSDALDFSGRAFVTEFDADDIFLLNITEDGGVTYDPRAILASNIFAPSDSKYYVQQNLDWVDLDFALTQVGLFADVIDGGDFGLTLALGSDNDIFDGGDFSTTTANGTTTEALDGGAFAGVASNLLLDGGLATL